MYPLESVFSVRMTRNQDQVVRGLEKFLGRKYDYRPENDLERQYTYYPVETQEQIRVRVSLSAIRGLIVHMGTLKEGRKQLIVVSEGFSNRLPLTVREQNPTVGGGGIGPGGNGVVDPIGAAGLNENQADFAAQIDMEQLLRDVYDEANKNNVSIYTVDPRGLAVSEFDVSDGNVDPTTDRLYLNQTTDTLRTLAVETDGRAIVNRNDLVGGMRQIVRDVSAYYLLGYNSTQTTADGKFHEIKVRVKRPGVQVRARKGYWALTHEELSLSSALPKPKAPAAVTAALASVVTTSAASKARPDSHVDRDVARREREDARDVCLGADAACAGIAAAAGQPAAGARGRHRRWRRRHAVLPRARARCRAGVVVAGAGGRGRQHRARAVARGVRRAAGDDAAQAVGGRRDRRRHRL